MKTWISFLLPEDEYKQKRMLYFYSEAAIILFLSLIIMLISNRYLSLDLETVLLLAIAIFLFYVSGRYILSGMEYADISTEKAYKKELRVIFTRTIGFVIIFITIFLPIYLIFVTVPSNFNEWIDILGLLISVSAVWILTSYISLRRSFKKNKDLI